MSTWSPFPFPNVPWSLKGVARIFQKGEGLTMSNGGTHQFRHLSVESLFLKKKGLKRAGWGDPRIPSPQLRLCLRMITLLHIYLNNFYLSQRPTEGLFWLFNVTIWMIRDLTQLWRRLWGKRRFGNSLTFVLRFPAGLIPWLPFWASSVTW